MDAFAKGTGKIIRPTAWKPFVLDLPATCLHEALLGSDEKNGIFPSYPLL